LKKEWEQADFIIADADPLDIKKDIDIVKVHSYMSLHSLM